MQKVSLVNVSFSTAPTVSCTCDRCGQGIKNIWSVSFSNGVTYKYGIDCFEKLSKNSNLTDTGRKNFKKLLKSLKQSEEFVAKWSTITYDQYIEEYWANIPEEDRHVYCDPLENEYNNPEHLDWEGYRNYRLNNSMDTLNRKKAELANFKKAWFVVED